MSPADDIRRYRDGDEEVLSRLFNARYSGYNGFQVKTATLWKHCFVDHPCIGRDRILVMDAGGPSAYLAYGRDGIVYDICMDDRVRGPASCRRLVVTAIRRAREEGVCDMQFFPQETDRIVKRALLDLGFCNAGVQAAHIVKIADMQRLIEKRIRNSRKPIGVPVAFEIVRDFTPEADDPAVEPAVRFRYVPDEARTERTQLTIRCGWLAFADRILGGKALWSGFLNRSIRVYPRRRTLAGWKILSDLRVGGRWHVAMIDKR